MRLLAPVAVLLLSLHPVVARADDGEATGPAIGGVWGVAGLSSHGFSGGVHFATRYQFVQAGVMGLLASNARAGLGTIGVVLPTEGLEVSLEALGGVHSIDSARSSSGGFFGGSCATDGPSMETPAVGGMFTLGRSMRKSGLRIGVSAFVLHDLRTKRVQTTRSCENTLDLFGDGSGTTSSSSPATLGGTSVGALFRFGFGIF